VVRTGTGRPTPARSGDVVGVWAKEKALTPWWEEGQE
jgi:hypothetical protein